MATKYMQPNRRKVSEVAMAGKGKTRGRRKQGNDSVWLYFAPLFVNRGV